MAKQPPDGFPNKLISRLGLAKILVLLLVMMIAGTVGSVGFLSFRYGQEGVNDLATQLQDSLQDRIKHELDEFLSKPHALNRINAEALRSGLVNPRNFSGQRLRFLQQVQTFPSVVTCAFGSAGGDFIGAGWRSDGVFDSALADKAADDDYRVFILNGQGQPAQLVDTVHDYDPRPRSWYQAALKAGEPTWSPVYIWASQQNIGISAVVPVYDGSGALMGVQLSALSLEHISRFLGGLKIGQSGQAFIVERSGMMVASSFEPSIRPSAESQRATAERFQAIESASPLIRSAAGYLTERHGNLDRIVRDERMRVAFSGENYFLNVAPFSDKRGLEWLVGVIVPESDFTAHVDANARLTLLMSIAALVVAVLFGVSIARWLTQPILKLNAAAQEMSQGKWQEIAVPERFHEVGQLAASFNRMGVQLRGVFETLESRVRERTHALASANEQLHIEIVERKQVEEALRAREADLREAQRVAHIGSWHWDAHTDIITGTDELLRIYGLDPATQKIPNFKDQLGVWYLVEEWKRLNAAVQETMRTGVGYHMDVQALRSGVPIWITTRCEIVRDPDGRIAGLRGTVQDITERKQAEEAQRESEERFRAVFESSNDCILVWDRQYNYLYANQAAIDHVGTTRDKVIGRNMRDGLGHVPDFMRLWMERVDRAFATGEPFRVEDAVPVGDRLVYSESQISPIRDAARRVFAVGVAYRDTTARKQVEEALRQSEQRLVRAQEIAHLGSWELDLVASHLTWSDEVYRIFGLTPREFGATYEAFLERVHPDDRAAVDAAYSGSLRESRDSYEIEHRVVRKDTGEVRHIHEKCEHFRNVDGQIVRSVGMVHDITERKQAEEALKQSERRFRALTEKASEFITILDEKGKITYNMAGSNNSLGYTAGDMVGSSGFELVHPEDLPRVLELFQQSASQPGRIEHAEVRVRAKDGSWRWQSAVGTNLLNDPSVGGIIINSFDITERKQAEEALRQLNENLEQRVAERTSELAHTVETLQGEIKQRVLAEHELKLANEQLAERADQLRRLAGQLTMAEQAERKRLSKILHDGLQQHLASAKLQLGGLSDGLADDDLKQAKEIDKTIAESMHMSRSLSVDLSPPVLYDGGLSSGLEWLARWMRDKYNLNVELSIEDKSQLPEDVKIFLFESVRELLFNTVKHAQVSRARVRMRQMGGAGLQIIVSDEGAGFDPCQLKSAGENGGGFGLFSIRERIGLIGGSVQIDSAPGKGSRLALMVPHGPAPAVVPLSVDRMCTPVAEAQEDTVKDQGTTIRVLLADDHALFRNGLGRLLKNEPCLEVVGQAADGKEAIELAQKLKPDVILMDVSMPRVNGIEATRIIHGQYPDIRIIGLSMYEDEERAQAMRDAGAADYKTKGCAAAELVAAIRTCLQEREYSLEQKPHEDEKG